MIRVLLIVIGYCFGLIQTGYLLAKMHGIDIHSEGSGNSGATNSLRVMGKKAGAIVFFVDMLKCFLPCMAVRLIWKDQPDMIHVYLLYMAIGVILGHNYPFYLKFRGGKGIASSAGLILAFDWRICLVCLIAFVAVVAVTRYVSVGSMLILAILCVFGIVFAWNGWILVASGCMAEYMILLVIILLLGCWRHRANINRLIHGTENKIGSKK